MAGAPKRLSRKAGEPSDLRRIQDALFLADIECSTEAHAPADGPVTGFVLRAPTNDPPKSVGPRDLFAMLTFDADGNLIGIGGGSH
jgi:hypothetical protein